MTEEYILANKLSAVNKKRDFIGLSKLFTEHGENLIKVLMKYTKLKYDLALHRVILLNFEFRTNLDLIYFYTSTNNYELLLLLMNKIESYYEYIEALKYIFESEICVMKMFEISKFKSNLNALGFYKKIQLLEIGLGYKNYHLDKLMFETFDININYHFVRKFPELMKKYPRISYYMKVDTINLLGNKKFRGYVLGLLNKVLKNSDISERVIGSIICPGLKNSEDDMRRIITAFVKIN